MKTKIICEIGSNWASIDDILYSCEWAATNGCWPKLQAWQTELVVNKERNPKMYDVMKKYELPLDWMRKINNRFPETIYSVFDLQSLDYVRSLHRTNEVIKIASPDCVYHELLDAVAKCGEDAIVSVGGATLDEIRAVARKFEWQKLTFLHCVVDYNKHDYMINYFKDRVSGSRLIPWGCSFNYPSKILPAVCVGIGATMIEMHFKMHANMDTPDSGHSFTPNEFSEMLENVREVESNLGNSERPTQNEVENLRLGRRKEDGLR